MLVRGPQRVVRRFATKGPRLRVRRTTHRGVTDGYADQPVQTLRTIRAHVQPGDAVESRESPGNFVAATIVVFTESPLVVTDDREADRIEYPHLSERWYEVSLVQDWSEHAGFYRVVATLEQT